MGFYDFHCSHPAFSGSLTDYATIGCTRNYCGADFPRLEQTVQRTGGSGEHNNRIQIARYRVEVTKEPGPLRKALLGRPPTGPSCRRGSAPPSNTISCSSKF